MRWKDTLSERASATCCSDMASPSSWETVSALIQAKQTRILYPAVHHGWNFLGSKTRSANSNDSWMCVPSEDFVVQLVHGATSVLSKDPGFHDLVLMGLSPTTIQVKVGAKRKRGSFDDVVEGAMYLTSLTLQSSEDDDAYAESLIASCLTEEKVEGILEWKPSDEFRKSSSKLVAQLVLASNAEKLLSSKDCRLSRSSYNQVSHVRSDSFESPFPSTHTRPTYSDCLHLQTVLKQRRRPKHGHCASLGAAQCHARVRRGDLVA